MNNYIEEKDNDRKKIMAVIVMILMLMFLTTGATYAYFSLSATNSSANGTASTASLTLAVTRETPDTTKWNASTKVMVPQLDAGLGTAINSTNKCVDANSNVVCQIFKIVITNASTAKVKLRGSVYFTIPSGSAYQNLYWKSITNATTLGSNNTFKYSTAKATHSTTADAANATLVNPLTLNATNGSQTYYVLVWIREINSDQQNVDKGTWNMTVEFNMVGNSNEEIGGITSTITS